MTRSFSALPHASRPSVQVIASPAVLVVGGYVGALTIAELTLLTSGLVAGAIAHAIVMVALVAHYVAAPGVAYRRLLLALALPSLMRLIGLSVPIAGASPLLWIVAAGVPALLAALLCARALGAVPSSMLRWPGRALGAQVAVAAGGAMHGLLAFLVLRPAPIVEPTAVGILSAIVGLGLFAAFTEELVFRGIIQPLATEILSSRGAGLLVSTTVFTVMYLGSLSLPFIVFMFAIGLFFGWIAQEGGSLWGVIGAHTLLSVGLLAVWPFLLR